MYVQVDYKLLEAYMKKGSCLFRTLKYKRLKRQRKR